MIKIASEKCFDNTKRIICSYDENTESSDIKVYANGKLCTLYTSSNCLFVNVIADDFTDIKVEYNKTIKDAKIKPSRFERKIDFSENTAYFTVKCGDYICVEFNDDLPLFVFADKKFDLFDYNNCDVIYFEDNKTYECDINITKSNTVVFIGENTVIKGKFRAINVDNIKILGNGTIDGTKTEEYAIAFKSCKNIEINGITALGAKIWITMFLCCKNIHIENFKALGDIMRSDGIDIVSSQNVYIHHIFVRNEDDCICIKSGKINRCPFKVTTQKVKNVYVSDCTFFTGERGNSLEIGYEAMKDISDIKFKNIDIIHRKSAKHKFNRCVISIHNAGTANIYNVLYENIFAEYSDENFIMLSHMVKSEWGHGEGSIKNITFRNVHLVGGKNNPPSYISTLPINMDNPNSNNTNKQPVDNIVFENVLYKGEKIDCIDKAKACNFTISDDINIKFL